MGGASSTKTVTVEEDEGGTVTVCDGVTLLQLYGDYYFSVV